MLKIFQVVYSSLYGVLDVMSKYIRINYYMIYG